MITRSIFKASAVLTAAAFMSMASAAKPTLQQVTEETEAAVAKAPDKAAEIVAEKVTATPEYACPIIKAAVKGGNLAMEVQPDLVAAALEAAPEQAPEIKACLPNLLEAAAGKGGSDGKEGATGKDKVAGQDGVSKGADTAETSFLKPLESSNTEAPAEEEGPDTGLSGGDYDSFYGVIGVYLSIPASAPVTKKPRVSNPGTFSQPSNT